MVIVPLSELTSDSLDTLINTRNADGLLILLPKYTRRTKESQIESWRQLESDLLQKRFNIPIYFAWEDAALQVHTSSITFLLIQSRISIAMLTEFQAILTLKDLLTSSVEIFTNW